MSVKLDVKGVKELQKVLKGLPHNIQKNAMKSAIRAGGRVVVKSARNNLPGNYQTLRKSLTVKVLRPKSSTKLVAIIGPTVGRGARYDGWYAHIVERGAAPHDIPLSTQKAFQLSTNLEVRSGSSGTPGVMRHPGVTAKPFLKPALESNQRNVLEAMKDQIWKYLEKQRKKGKI